MVRKTLGFVALLVSSLVFACGTSSSRDGFGEGAGAGPGDGTGAGEEGENKGSLGNSAPPVEPPEPEECQKMDIIFVVDDSGSMKEEQQNLAANFPKFVSKIDSFKTKSGSKLDWRIAVTTTATNITYNIEMPPPFGGTLPMSEKGDDGAFRMPSACGTKRRWIEKSDPSASSDFQCLAQAGTGGSSIEMPLQTTKLALNDRVADGTNAGFLRDDALLALVILTDEDDCSRDDNNFTIQNDVCSTMQGLKPIADYKTMLDLAAKGEGRWATAVIAGPTSCESGFGKAVEAKRLKEFVGMAGKNGTFSSICEGDLSGALEKALDTFDAACKTLPPSNVK